MKPGMVLSEIIDPSNFDDALAAVKHLCVPAVEKSIPGKMLFEKPSLALKVGMLLKKTANIVCGIALRETN